MKIRSIDPSMPEVKMIDLDVFRDDRGWFCEAYNLKSFDQLGLNVAFVQDNHSRSFRPGTVRGLHYQAPPFAQCKLVRCTRGAALDVVVDIRRGSPSYGRHLSVELSEDEAQMLFVPVGFAHGFAARADNVEIVYKVDAYYDRDSDRALKWDDPDLGIDWGVSSADAIVSPRDAAAGAFVELSSPFIY